MNFLFFYIITFGQRLLIFSYFKRNQETQPPKMTFLGIPPRDGPWPDPSIFLVRNKLGSDPGIFLTCSPWESQFWGTFSWTWQGWPNSTWSEQPKYYPTWVKKVLAQTRDVHWPDPNILLTRSKEIRSQPIFDPTQSRFFDPKGKKLKNLGFLREIFLTQTKDGWPDPTHCISTSNPTNIISFEVAKLFISSVLFNRFHEILSHSMVEKRSKVCCKAVIIIIGCQSSFILQQIKSMINFQVVRARKAFKHLLINASFDFHSKKI